MKHDRARRWQSLASRISPLLIGLTLTGGYWVATEPSGPPVAVAQEPAPVVVPVDPTPDPQPPEPAPFEPELMLAERFDEGEPIEARVVPGTLPSGAKFSVEWESDAKNRAQAGPGHKRYFWAAKGSTHVVRINCVLVNGEQISQKHRCKSFTVGDPPPPPVVKTLAELAGKDAAVLSAIYTDLASASDRYELVSVFRAVAEASTLPYKANPAVVEITKRFDVLGKPTDKVDAKQLADLLAGIIEELGAPTPSTPTTPSTPVPVVPGTAATYVYDKRTTAVPAGVSTGLNRLNREKNVLATLFEDDTKDADGDVPEQYKVPLAAAKESGLPALVVTADGKVLSVVKNPTTEEAVIGAVR